MKENELIDWIQQTADPVESRLLRGIGDDAAVLGAPASDLVVTTDLIADGVHFESRTATPSQIGRKALAVNLSDIAAMAAKPMAAFVSLLLPDGYPSENARALMQAIIQLGREFDCPIAGGDTNVWHGKLAINVAVLGQVPWQGPLLRSTAVPGDYLLVTGVLGGSQAGHHFDFKPRIAEALLLHERYELHAGMDLSDGLAMDLRRMCVQSGCGAEVLVDNLPLSAAALQGTTSRQVSQRRALGDGEDFELLLAVAPDEARRVLDDQPLDVPITHIGFCEAGSEVWQRMGGQRIPLPPVGYEHGRNDTADAAGEEKRG